MYHFQNNSMANFRTIENIPAVGAGDCTNYQSLPNIDWLTPRMPIRTIYSSMFHLTWKIRPTTVSTLLLRPDGSNVDLSGNTNISVYQRNRH